MLRADVLAFDKHSLRRFDVDGRMHVVDCRISKANVCPYYGSEIPDAEALGLDPEKIYQLYRDPVELARAAPTFANLQLMLAHVPVSANEPQIELTVGAVGADVRFEEPYLVASLAVWTAEAIKLVESKAQAQLSCSYRYTAVMGAGVSPEGVAYDGRMCNIIGNHVALVEEGRAGPDVIVNDATPTPKVRTMKFAKLIASLVKLGVIAKDAKPEGLDAELEKLGAKDAEVDAKADDEETDEEKAAREKAAKDAETDMGARGGNQSTAAALDAALKAGTIVSKADVDALVSAARLDGANDAVARVNALHVARDAVKPLCGVVALDSAESVYRFALDHIKVENKGVKEVTALAALVDAHKSRLANDAARPVPAARMAADAAGALSEAIPGLSRINHA